MLKSCHKIVWTVCGKHSGSISNRLLVIMISFDSYFKFHSQKPLINKIISWTNLDPLYCLEKHELGPSASQPASNATEKYE